MNLKRITYSLAHPAQARLEAEGKAAFCDTCDKIVSGFMCGTKDGISVYTCLECCDKENEGKTFKYENNDKEKQVVEYNSYDKDGNKLGGVNIHYFTEEQIEEIEKIKEQIAKERNG